MNKKNNLIIASLSMAIFFVLSPISLLAHQAMNQSSSAVSSPNDKADFQNWLAKNGQIGKDTAPIMLAEANTAPLINPLLNERASISAQPSELPKIETTAIPPIATVNPPAVLPASPTSAHEPEVALTLNEASAKDLFAPLLEKSAGITAPKNVIETVEAATPLADSPQVDPQPGLLFVNHSPPEPGLQLALNEPGQAIIPPPVVHSVPMESAIPPAPLAPPVSQIPPHQVPMSQGQNNQIMPPPMQEAIPPPPFMQPQNIASQQPPLPKKHLIRTQKGSGAEETNVQTPPMTFSQNQEVMINQAPPAPLPSPDSNAAFNAMMQQNVPLSPQQVVKLRQQIDVQQRAAAIPANIPPKPVSSTLMVNLAPGTTPPAIRLSQGYISSLVFVDSTGSPWPIASYDIGDPRKLGPIQWDGKSNVLLLQAISPYGDSDLIIRLVGLPTPIAFALVFGQRVVDYRVDIHVSGIGPNAKELPTGTGLPNNANQLLLSVLDGIAPAGSKTLHVTGGDCQAWLLGDKMYLRTRFTVLSPGWIGRMVSPDGMHAYEIQRSSSVLISQYGSPTELKIEGF